MWDGLQRYVESESDALGLLLLLSVSPLSPLSTIEELKNRGLYSYLPGIEKILDGDFGKGISERMKEVLNAAVISDREGSKKPLDKLYDRIISNISTQLELMDYNLSQVYQFVSIFITLIPSILFSTVVFTNPDVSIILLKAISFFSLISSFLGMAIFPWEMRIPSPSYKVFFILFIIIGLYKFFSLLNLDNPMMLSLSMTSLPLMILSIKYYRFWKRILDDVSKKLEKASTCIWNIFECIGVDEPERLLDIQCFGISKAVMTSLYLFGMYGLEELSSELSKLSKMYNDYINSFSNLRKKTRVMLFYSVLEVSVSAVIYVFLLHTLSYFSSIDVLQGVPIVIPTKNFLVDLRNIIDFILSLNSVSLSILTSTVREGNPMYFGIYLFFVCNAVYISYTLSSIFVTGLLGV